MFTSRDLTEDDLSSPESIKEAFENKSPNLTQAPTKYRTLAKEARIFMDMPIRHSK